MNRRGFFKILGGLAATIVASQIPIPLPEVPVVAAPSFDFDLVTTTLRDFGQMKWTDICSSLQRYEATKLMLKRGRVTMETDEVLIKWTQ